MVAQWLRAPAALVENRGSVPSNCMAAHSHSNSNCRGSITELRTRRLSSNWIEALGILKNTKLKMAEVEKALYIKSVRQMLQ